MKTALWASEDEGTPMDDRFTVQDFAPETMNLMKREAAQFMKIAGHLLNQAEQAGYDISRSGHDFWLTRNHHGTGFWDRIEGKLGDHITEIAERFGEASLYVGDDGQIYQFQG